MNNNSNENNIKVEFKEITDKDIKSFKENGYLIFDNIIPNEKQVNKLLKTAKGCFHYEYDKGISPDEVTWRLGSTDNFTTRSCSNSWKTNSAIAQLVLNEQVGEAACKLLGDCDSVRVVQDDIFYKPANGGTPIGFHQDLPYLDCFENHKAVTLWVALTNVSMDNGTLEFVQGSNNWDEEYQYNDSNETTEFHAPSNYLRGLELATAKKGLSMDQLIFKDVTVKAGGASFHNGSTWHGSRTNNSLSDERIVIAMHLVPGDTKFGPTGKNQFNFGRYRIYNSTNLEESFFPIIYSKNGYKSPCIIDYMKPPTPN